MKRKTQLGSSLIEVLVALLVTAIGLLGVLSMQVKAIQFNKNAHLYSQATILATDLMESIRTTPEEVDAFVNATTSTKDCSTSQCDSEDMAKWQKTKWLAKVKSSLPGGEATVTKKTIVNGASTEEEIEIMISFVMRIDKSGVEPEVIKDSVVLYTKG